MSTYRITVTVESESTDGPDWEVGALFADIKRSLGHNGWDPEETVVVHRQQIEWVEEYPTDPQEEAS